MNSNNQEHQAEVGASVSSFRQDLFLGVIHTSITGKKCSSTPSLTEEPAILIRETTNLLDPFAIRVHDKDQNPIGYVSRSVSKWLSPLMKKEMVRVEAKIPGRSGMAQSLKSSSNPLLIFLHRSSPDHKFWEIEEIKTRKDVLHQLVYQAFQAAQGYRELALVEYLFDGLRPLAKQELHPQTHLLLALLANGINPQLQTSVLHRWA